MATTSPDAGTRTSGATPTVRTRLELGWVVAALSGAAGVIHFTMIPAHAASNVEPILFAIAGWFQVGVAAAILARRGSRALYAVTALGTAAILATWVWSRTVGLPFGVHANEAEDVGVIDALTAALEVGVVVVSIRLLLGDARQRVTPLVPALAAIGAVALATFAVTSPDAAGHGHDETTMTVDAHTAQMRAIDAKRCDKGLNPKGYWDETKTLGVDTYAGGTMSMGASTAATSGGDGHSHGGAAAAPAPVVTSTTQPDPTRGRGSVGLDLLVASTKAAGKGEAAAGKLIADLAHATERDYDAWLYWMRSTGQVGHPHDTASPDEGHGGHAGPHTWTAMTWKTDCARLEKELARARKAALAMPTAQDAIDAGYRRVTFYLPGIGAHYINLAYVDDRFEIDKPEMVLYDGDGPDASVVGLSYYLLGSPELEPTQGFTGTNDHFHRHVGLCMRDGVIVGDTTMPEEDCKARGGFKLNAIAGWMNHAWVVPGCESPWGVFSAASPVLDDELGRQSGKDGGHCAGSSVRERYGLGKAPTASTAKAVSKADTGSSTDTGEDVSASGTVDTGGN